MASSRVDMRFFADQAAAERAIVQLEKRLDGLDNKLRQTSRNSRRGADEGATGFKSLGLSVEQVTSRLLAATGGMAALRAEWENLQQAQERARASQLGFAAAFDQALFNSGGMSAEDLSALINRISESSGVNPTRAANALSTALSARGNLSIEDTEFVVTESLKLSRNLPELTAPLSQAALDIQKRFGSQGADARDALGFLLRLGEKAEVTETSALAQAVGPGLLGVSREGASARGAGALVAAFTQATGDTTGRASANASISFARQLAEAVPQEATFEARLAAVQRDEKLRAQFLGGLSLEKRFIGAAESLSAGGDVAALFEDAFQALPDIANAQDFLTNIQREQARGPTSGVAALDAALATSGERALLADTEGGQRAVLRQRVRELQQAAGVSAIGQTATQLFGDVLSRVPGLDPITAQQIAVGFGGTGGLDILPGRNQNTLRVIDQLEAIKNNTGRNTVNRDAQTEAAP